MHVHAACHVHSFVPFHETRALRHRNRASSLPMIGREGPPPISLESMATSSTLHRDGRRGGGGWSERTNERIMGNTRHRRQTTV